MDCFHIIGLRVNHRRANAAKLQEALTAFGCNIRLRVGLHETDESFCSDDGVILLQVCGGESAAEKMTAALNALEGVRARWMDLN